MLAIGVRYLLGWSMATDVGDLDAPEWPPHPARLFSAFAAAHFETGAETESEEALRFLEALPPPSLVCTEAMRGATMTHYVPVNDVTTPKKAPKIAPFPKWAAEALPVMPAHRPRQARTFPRAIPLDDTVYFVWPGVDSTAHRKALARLAMHVGSLGHSASLVHVFVTEDAPPASLVMTSAGNASVRLRVPMAGRLAELAADYTAGRRPTPEPWVGYAPPAQSAEFSVPGSFFAPELVVLARLEGPALPSEATLTVTAALRGAVMHHCTEPIPESISGHSADGSPSQLPHLAFIALPHVAHSHADGRLMGCAVVLPRTMNAGERAQCLRSIAKIETLNLGRIGQWQVGMEDDAALPKALRQETWTSAACDWASVTPVVLDRFPKKEGDAELAVAMACERIGLPRPVTIILTDVSLHLGAPVVRDFPPYTTGSGTVGRSHVHVLLRFKDPVQGPILLGTGRFRGYGLCRPYRTMSLRQP